MSKRLPETETPIDQQLKRGREAFTQHFNFFLGSASSTDLMKLADTVCGKRYIHSSMIQNLRRGTIKDPNHAALLALGAVNRHISEGGSYIFVPMRKSDGSPIDESTVHLAFLGLIDLQPLPETLSPWPTPEQENLIVQKLSHEARKTLINGDVDFYQNLDQYTPLVSSLLTSKKGLSLREILNEPSLYAVLGWDKSYPIELARTCIGRES